MPSWNIHLEAGRRLSKKMKLSPEKEEEFLFGCLLPDINNGYLNKNVKEIREHHETHWAFDEKSSLNFYAKYRDKIDEKDPIYFGYLFHLYTDGYFNYDFYRKINKDVRFSDLSHEEKSNIKHNDFWKYDVKFSDRELVISDRKKLVEKANTISSVMIDEDAILEIEKIFEEDFFSQEAQRLQYIFYSENDLDELLDEMIKNFSENYLEKKDA